MHTGITPVDIERANFYSAVCGSDFQKALDLHPELSTVDWELFRFTWLYCREVLGSLYDDTVADVMADLKP